jgi:hypothetical protein
MNTERALGTFFNEINKAIDVSKKPVQDVLNYYLSSSWKSFEASWFLKSVEKGTESNQEVNALKINDTHSALVKSLTADFSFAISVFVFVGCFLDLDLDLLFDFDALGSSWKSFEASWFLKSVEKETEPKEVNALNAVGFEHLPDYQKENMIINREKFREERGFYDEN